MPFKPQNPTVWIELPVLDLEKAKAFYETVFDFDIKIHSSMPPNPVGMISSADEQGVAGHLYPGKPPAKGTGPTVHLCVPDTVEDAMDRVVNNGGEEVSPVITIPPGRFAYALDPDGNSIGLFQPAAA